MCHGNRRNPREKVRQGSVVETLYAETYHAEACHSNLAANSGMKMRRYDFVAAYLQGDLLEDEW